MSVKTLDGVCKIARYFRYRHGVVLRALHVERNAWVDMTHSDTGVLCKRFRDERGEYFLAHGVKVYRKEA